MWRSLEQAAEDPVLSCSRLRGIPGTRPGARGAPRAASNLEVDGRGVRDGGARGVRYQVRRELDSRPSRSQPNIIPGLPNFYATAHVLDGFATGTLVKHVMGRPINVQGNSKHPASLGAIGVFAQAQLLGFLRSGPRCADQQPRRAV